MEIKIRCDMVSNISARSKFDPDTGDQLITLSIETYMAPATLARILNLQKQRVPFYFELGSNQATMDLELIAFGDKQEALDKGLKPDNLEVNGPPFDNEEQALKWLTQTEEGQEFLTEVYREEAGRVT